MEHFTKEPEKILTIKWLLLLVGSLGFVLFLFEYLLAWLYPIMGNIFNRLILFHVFHLMLIIATCIVRGGLIQMQWFALYISSYIMCFIMDSVGCIWRTILLNNEAATLNPTSYSVGVIALVIEWILPVICIVQIIISIAIARMTKLYLYAQDLVIGVLMRSNGNDDADILIQQSVKKLSGQFGFSWRRVKNNKEKN